MIDFIAKARTNRIIALNLSSKGTEMFFPEDDTATRIGEVNTGRRAVTHVSRSMRLRSQSVQTSAMIEAPRSDMIANGQTDQAPQDVFVLTKEFAIADAECVAA
ncbi:TFIIIC subunit 6 family protein [Pacificibacter marinus]|uniref:TFIIIC subunit 6 family protein n=1 Tax=Pacificibacter marinus TaxID=658057 RepID=UPI001C06AB10|nr:TFIIIC subunit 6 family protein [Pacificibacter marinus]MBU2866124.1 TFIIIC subunit 6 family protein [Pacificibacter marinus]